MTSADQVAVTSKQLDQAWVQLRRGLLTRPGLPRPWTPFEDAPEGLPSITAWTPSASTAPWKTGKRPPVSHSANRPNRRQWSTNTIGNADAAAITEAGSPNVQSVTHVAGLSCHLCSRSHRG